MNQLAMFGGKPIVPVEAIRKWPEITDDDRNAVDNVLSRGQLAGAEAPEITGLERDWARYIGTEYCLAFNGGTAAIHAALFATGVQKGDEVITSAFSFSGTFLPILHLGAIPIFVDISPETYNIDVDQIETRITDHTKVLLPVHIHGLPAEMAPILGLANRFGLYVVEDAAQAHGATYKGKRVGGIGDLGCFSLNQSKNLPAGEGGLLNTNNEEFFERASMIRVFGEKRAEPGSLFRTYRTHIPGFNYPLQEMTAALARSQLRRLDRYNETSQANARYLSSELSRLRGIYPPQVPDGMTSVYHKYRVRFKISELGMRMHAAMLRDRLLQALQAEGVKATLWHVEPLPLFPIFGGKYSRRDFPNACELLDSSIILCDEKHPIFIQLPEVIESYAAAFKKVYSNLDMLQCEEA